MEPPLAAPELTQVTVTSKMSEQQHSRRRPNRRSVIKGIAGGMMGAGAASGVSPDHTLAAASSGTPPRANPHAAPRLIWKLDRPKPALPNSYFWTWDHRTNWMPDDPGTLNFGCSNRYLKQPETYVEDYRRLTDMAAGLGVKGIVIWGFLRDDHGGIGASKRVADYAAANGVAIMPGVGTNAYGGIYYEGDHPYSIGSFIKKHPEARSIDKDGKPRDYGVCPSHPAFTEWLQGGIQWLFREFAIGGANLENGDFNVCHCPKCREKVADWPDEPEFWMHQCLGYEPALNAVKDQLSDKFITWATYTGFLPGEVAFPKHTSAYLRCRRPVVLRRLPKDAVCQWTLTRMVRDKALPLTAYLDDGTPAEALTNKKWAADVKPPAGVRSVGYMHQGSMLYSPGRYNQAVSSLKEGCLRAYRAGLEGVSIYGEMPSRHIPWALNYLAFSHFIHSPEDSLRQFGRKTLGQVLGSEDEGEAFAELFAHWDARSLSDAQKEDIEKRSETLRKQVQQQGEHMTRWRFWHWLMRMARDWREPHTVSII